MTESRRSHFRRNLCRFGALRLDGGPGEAVSADAACLVWDLSETGAMVEVEGDARVPDRVGLVLDGAGEPRPCAVARRDGRRLGLRFVG